MENTQKFAEKLVEIADLAFSHGTDSIPEHQKRKPADQWTPEQMGVFMSKCREGFKLAQKRLIEEVLSYQSLLKENKEVIKAARTSHDKSKVKEHLELENVIEQRLHNLSHIADGLAIQMLGQQVHIARRLHMGEKAGKTLEHSNIAHAIKVADKINEDPDNFALISDLTSIIQIGDLLVADKKKGLYITELKEGKTNERIRNFIDLAQKHGIPCDNFQSDFSPKENQQMIRMLKQDLKAAQAVEVINTDKGTDPASGATITVRTPGTDLEYYDGIFIGMLEDLKEKEWSYRVWDECLHIGMYQGKTGMMLAPMTITSFLKTQEKKHIVVDLMLITKKLSETLFAKPIPKDFIVKIMTGQAKIMIGIDFDQLIEIFNRNGLKTRWLSTKETAKFKEAGKNLEIVTFNNKGIGIELEPGMEGVMSWGIISKIVFDNISPSSLAISMATPSGPAIAED